MELKIEYLPLSALTPYEGNARKHADEDINAIMASIQEFGFDDPIGIWGKDNVIVEGHGRLMAAKELGMNTVPVIRLDHLTDEQRRAYALAHNKTAELSGWDFGQLEMELAGISEVDMSAFGFDVPPEGEEQTITEDEPPEEAEPRCKLGDLWKCGNHRLICADSTNPENIKTLLDGQTVPLLLTDPPYGINVVEPKTDGIKKVGDDKPITIKGPVHRNGRNRIIQKATEYFPVIGDDTTETAENGYSVAQNVTENQIIFGGNYFTEFLPPSRCWLIWDKQNSGSFADAELAWTSFKHVVRIYRHMWNGLIRQGDRTVEGKTRVHPTQKPVGMLAEILKDFSTDGDGILDMFGGSGSTMIACEQLTRNCYMAELDPRYCDIIIERWETFTGKKAELISEGNGLEKEN